MNSPVLAIMTRSDTVAVAVVVSTSWQPDRLLRCDKSEVEVALPVAAAELSSVGWASCCISDMMC